MAREIVRVIQRDNLLERVRQSGKTLLFGLESLQVTQISRVLLVTLIELMVSVTIEPLSQLCVSKPRCWNILCSRFPINRGQRSRYCYAYEQRCKTLIILKLLCRCLKQPLVSVLFRCLCSCQQQQNYSVQTFAHFRAKSHRNFTADLGIGRC